MLKNHRYFVYILKCNDQSYYVGVTNNLELRVEQHQIGTDVKSYTYKRRPIELVWYEEFKYIDQAIAFEKKLKGWSRAKKTALITNEYQKLPGLSKKKF